MTIKDPLFTAEDVEVLHRKSRDILATDPFGSRDVRKIADRLQQWIDQQPSEPEYIPNSTYDGGKNGFRIIDD